MGTKNDGNPITTKDGEPIEIVTPTMAAEEKEGNPSTTDNGENIEKNQSVSKEDQSARNDNNEKDTEKNQEYNVWLTKIPLVNIFFDLLHDVPTNENIINILNIVGLVSALLLSVNLATPLGFEYDEIVAFVERFDNEGGTYYEAGCNEFKSGQERLGMLAVDTVNAIVFSAASIFVVTIVYFSVCSSEYQSDEERKAWWFYASWEIILATLFMIIGVVYNFLMLKDIVVIKFPDYFIIENDGECEKGYFAWPMSDESPWGYTFHMSPIILGATLGVTILLTSLATMAKHRARDKNKNKKQQNPRMKETVDDLVSSLKKLTEILESNQLKAMVKDADTS